MNQETFYALLIVGGLVSIALLAYNWGWQAGHDVHHVDDGQSPEPPQPNRTLYR